MRNFSSRDYTEYRISRKFGHVLSKFSRNFPGNLIDAKFTSKFGAGILGLDSKILRKFWGGSILLLIFEARIAYDILKYIRLTI